MGELLSLWSLKTLVNCLITDESRKIRGAFFEGMGVGFMMGRDSDKSSISIVCLLETLAESCNVVQARAMNEGSSICANHAAATMVSFRAEYRGISIVALSCIVSLFACWIGFKLQSQRFALLTCGVFLRVNFRNMQICIRIRINADRTRSHSD